MAATFDSKRQLQRHLAAIVETTHDAIWSYGPDGRITSWNPAAERIFGWPAEAVLGREASFMLPPGRAWPLDPTGSHPVARVLRSGRALVVPDLDGRGALDPVAQSDEHRAFMQEAGYRCAVVLPLVARRRTLGIMSLLHVRADLRYD